MTGLIDKLPERYQKSLEIRDIENAVDIWSKKLREDYEDLIQNLNISTAESMLPLWEKMYGINDAQKSKEERRSAIMAKMRGQGTTTVSMIKSVAESFSGGTVEIVEDNENYKFQVRFTGQNGIPPNMSDLKKAIQEIKPAHLAVEFVYTYNTYGQLAAYTHAQLSAYTNGQLREDDTI